MSKDGPRTKRHVEQDNKLENLTFNDEVFEDTKHHFGIKTGWIRTIQVVASRPKSSKPLGTVIGIIIRRESIGRGRFWEKMSEISPSTMAIAFKLFNRHGKIRRDRLSEPGHARSTTFGREINFGSLLIIDSVNVDPDFRRRGVATAMLRHLFSKARDIERNVTFIFAWPGRVGHREQLGKRIGCGYFPKYDNNRAATEIPSYGLLRSLGFAKAPAKGWCAFAVDPNHRSHGFTSNKDSDLRVHTGESQLWAEYYGKQTREEELEFAAWTDATDTVWDEYDERLLKAADEYHHPKPPSPKRPCTNA